jgi:hypothetical protein
MRKVVPAILFALMVATPAPVSAVQGEEAVFRIRSLLLSVLFDGKDTGKDLVVDISVEFSGGKYVVNWDAVHVKSIDLPNNVKKTYLKAEHFGTNTGTVKNISVKEKVITFDLARDCGDMKVTILRLGEFGFDVEIKANGTKFSNEKQQRFNEEWVMTDQITLQSREVFGYPEKKPKRK